MKTATVRDLRNRFPRIAAWVAEGQSVEITGGESRLRGWCLPGPRSRAGKMPDIAARLDRTFGEACYDAADLARELAASRGGGLVIAYPDTSFLFGFHLNWSWAPGSS